MIAKVGSLQAMHFPGGRPVFLFALLVILGVALTLSAIYFWPDQNDGINLGSIDDFVPSSVTTSAEHGFHLVRLDSSEFLAFSMIDPHSSVAYAGRADAGDCQVAWRPDMYTQGKEGWFRDTCSGSTYDLDGTRVFGPSPRDLDRHPVTVEDGNVYVDTSTVNRGEDCCAAQD